MSKTLLKNLRIQNFKGWQDTGDIELAPITLFFGTNSSGKSSIGQFLMMLKQTVELSDRKMILHTGNANSYVNLGSFRNIIHRHDPKNELSFAYTWEPDADEKISFGESEKTVESIRFECCVGTDQNDKRNIVPKLKKCTYELSPADGTPMKFSLQRNRQSKFELQDDEKYFKKSFRINKK